MFFAQRIEKIIYFARVLTNEYIKIKSKNT